MADIIVAKTAGFCFGVNRAVKIAFDVADRNHGGCTLGPIIHRRYEGRYKTLGYSYPKATVWHNRLYISYSTNKEDVECTIVPLAFMCK